jgi:hypothetical protein
VQQVMIGREQPLGRFWPLTGQRRLVEHALLTALLETAPRVLLVGGEERGTWMLEQGMASDRAFAFAVGLSREPAGATGRISFVPSAVTSEASITSKASSASSCPTLFEFTCALADRQPLQWEGLGGAWALAWS